MKKVLSIVLGIIICLFAGWMSRLLQEPAMVWYKTLDLSSLTPPDNVFGIVWCILYVLLGISVGLLYNVHDISKRLLMWLFALQLIFNITWSLFFFNMQSPVLGLVNLLLLDVLAVAFFIGTLLIKRSSALLFLPYMLWVFFATYLNFYIVLNN